MAFLKRLIRALPLLLLSPFFMAISFLALLLTDLLTRRSAPRGARADVDVRPTFPQSATVVIPNWKTELKRLTAATSSASGRRP